MKLSVIAKVVRNIILDKIEDGIVNRFTESEIVTAANIVKDEMFGIRPDAFSINGIAVEPPSDLSSSRAALLFVSGDTVAYLDGLGSGVGASLALGKIKLSFRTESDGSLIHLGDGALNHISVTVASGSIVAEFSDADGATVATLILSGDFADDRWYDIEVSADGASATITDGEDSASVDYTGSLIPSTSVAYLGYTDIGGDIYFDGAMTSFEVEDDAETGLVAYPLNDGTGADLSETVGGYSGHVVGPEINWLEDDDLPIQPWAYRRFCYGVAAFILRQSGKDSFFRKAAEALENLYNGKQ